MVIKSQLTRHGGTNLQSKGIIEGLVFPEITRTMRMLMLSYGERKSSSRKVLIRNEIHYLY